jgi:hypothetical protein
MASETKNMPMVKWSVKPKRLPLEGCKGTYTHNVDTNNLAIGFLDLFQLSVTWSVIQTQSSVLEDTPKEVPEPRLGDDLIRRKDAHAVNFGCRIGLSGQMTPNNLIFLEAHLWAIRNMR